MVSTLLLAVAVAAGGWWYFDGRRLVSPSQANAFTTDHDTAPGLADGSGEQPTIVQAGDETLAWVPEPQARSEEALSPDAGEVLEPEGAAVPAWGSPVTPEQPDGQTPLAAAADSGGDQPSDNPAIEAARRQYAAGNIIEARHALNALLKQSPSRAEQAELRKLLTGIGRDTIFSSRRQPNDPLTDHYVVQSGDVLIHIGQRYKVPPEVLMRINGIRDATRLRADQKLKVLHGPFHVQIHKSAFRMDVYIQDLYVRSFRVALGAEHGTPEGVWRVKERLENPTYYPPASAEIKRIIPPDDPANPLGEYWIGLEGIGGDATDRVGYGIHGTIEPESIGKAVSLGCVRMHNEDVALLYALLLPGESTVTILP